VNVANVATVSVISLVTYLQVEEFMLKSVRDVIIRSNEAYPLVERHVWVTEWPGQVRRGAIGQTFRRKKLDLMFVRFFFHFANYAKTNLQRGLVCLSTYNV